MIYSYMNDKTFLNDVFHGQVLECYNRITALDWQERPLKEIQATTVGGSININASSAMRRTASLNMALEQDLIDLYSTSNYVSMNKKLKLEVGLKNTTAKYNKYPILWFPLGIFVITDVTLSIGSSGGSLSLQLKDKMCLLNGECGGVFPAATILNKTDEWNSETQTYTVVETPLYNLVYQLVEEFGQEIQGKILISDIPAQIKQVVKWTGAKTIVYDDNDNPVELQPNMNIGYRYVDLVYPGDFNVNAGESIVSALDKVKSLLGNYEYFYDVEGNFVFREIKNYLNITQATALLRDLNSEEYLVDFNDGKSVYQFDDNTLIASMNLPLQYNKIYNDFIIWGEKQNALGITLPFRYHLSIDKKPAITESHQVVLVYDDNRNPVDLRKPAAGESTVTFTASDWRTELYLQTVEGREQGLRTNRYDAELRNEWKKLYRIIRMSDGSYTAELKQDLQGDNLDYYLDFIDSSNTRLSELNISNIGTRTKVVKDSNINCIFEEEIPDYIIVLNTDTEAQIEYAEQGFHYCKLSQSQLELVKTGYTQNSAYAAMCDLLYQHTKYNESVSLTTLPIYYLDANSRITVRDTETHIYGDYIINSITVPLDFNSTMSINCTKIVDKL